MPLRTSSTVRLVQDRSARTPPYLFFGRARHTSARDFIAADRAEASRFSCTASLTSSRLPTSFSYQPSRGMRGMRCQSFLGCRGGEY
jgi:hypothetical protein